MLPVSFYLLLTNLVYVRSHGMFNSIPAFCTLYRRYIFPAMIPMCRSRRTDSLVLSNYWLWIRVVAYHYLHRPLVESLAPPSPPEGQPDTRESYQRSYCRNTSNQFVEGGSIFACLFCSCAYIVTRTDRVITTICRWIWRSILASSRNLW
jgi:hypothetical protein